MSVERVINAPAERIFALLKDIRQHHLLDGSGMVLGSPQGPDQLELGSQFTMAMKQAGASYRSVSRVVEYAEGRLIAWATTGEWRGHKVVGGQRWRYELEPVAEGTRVRESYVWGYASMAWTLRLGGYPSRMGEAMTTTLANLERAVTGADRTHE